MGMTDQWRQGRLVTTDIARAGCLSLNSWSQVSGDRCKAMERINIPEKIYWPKQRQKTKLGVVECQKIVNRVLSQTKNGVRWINVQVFCLFLSKQVQPKAHSTSKKWASFHASVNRIFKMWSQGKALWGSQDRNDAGLGPTRTPKPKGSWQVIQFSERNTF